LVSIEGAMRFDVVRVRHRAGAGVSASTDARRRELFVAHSKPLGAEEVAAHSSAWWSR
jgi:hypothetical protein